MIKDKGLKESSRELKIPTSTLKNWVTLCKDPKICHLCDNTKCCNGFYIEFRQSFAKETFSYDEHLKS